MTGILELLERDATMTNAEIAEHTGLSEAEVTAEIARFKDDGTILKYTAVVDWDKTNQNNGLVTALIEVKISPQRGDGYDRIAERIYQFDEVESLYLVSGSFDLAVLIRAKSMREISEFVYAHLAVIDGVTSTATHIIMRKYKEKYCVFQPEIEQEERGLLI